MSPNAERTLPNRRASLVGLPLEGELKTLSKTLKNFCLSAYVFLFGRFGVCVGVGDVVGAAVETGTG